MDPVLIVILIAMFVTLAFCGVLDYLETRWSKEDEYNRQIDHAVRIGNHK